MHDLGSNRNACRVLKNMERFLNSFRAEENVYYLNKHGRERIGSKTIRSKTSHYKHIIMRNDLYFMQGKPKFWKPEYVIEVGKLNVTTDVLFMKGVTGEDRYFFAEIDNQQLMINNLNKIRRYKQLKETGAFQKQYGYFPTLVWVVKTEHRKRELLKYGEGLKQEVLLWSVIR